MLSDFSSKYQHLEVYKFWKLKKKKEVCFRTLASRCFSEVEPAPFLCNIQEKIKGKIKNKFD
jgi:hypothetical protein